MPLSRRAMFQTAETGDGRRPPARGTDRASGQGPPFHGRPRPRDAVRAHGGAGPAGGQPARGDRPLPAAAHRAFASCICFLLAGCCRERRDHLLPPLFEGENPSLSLRAWMVLATQAHNVCVLRRAVSVASCAEERTPARRKLTRGDKVQGKRQSCSPSIPGARGEQAGPWLVKRVQAADEGAQRSKVPACVLLQAKRSRLLVCLRRCQAMPVPRILEPCVSGGVPAGHARRPVLQEGAVSEVDEGVGRLERRLSHGW